MENYEINLLEGKKSSVLISKEDSGKSVLDPSTMTKFLKELVKVEDNLDNTKNESSSTGENSKTIGDITISVGKGKVSKKIANCKFIVTNNKNNPVKDLVSILNELDWEIKHLLRHALSNFEYPEWICSEANARRIKPFEVTGWENHPLFYV